MTAFAVPAAFECDAVAVAVAGVSYCRAEAFTLDHTRSPSFFNRIQQSGFYDRGAGK